MLKNEIWEIHPSSWNIRALLKILLLWATHWILFRLSVPPFSSCKKFTFKLHPSFFSLHLWISFHLLRFFSLLLSLPSLQSLGLATDPSCENFSRIPTLSYMEIVTQLCLNEKLFSIKFFWTWMSRSCNLCLGAAVKLVKEAALFVDWFDTLLFLQRHQCHGIDDILLNTG